MNDQYHAAINMTPFYLTHGFHPRKGNETLQSSKSPAAEDYFSKFLLARANATEALKKAAKDMKRFYNKHKQQSIPYGKGSKVWLDGRHIKTYRPNQKLDHKKLGPFIVEDKVGSSAYQLRLPQSWNHVHPVFNEVLLSPYHPAVFPGQIPPPPPGPIVIDDYLEYDVEEILTSCCRG